MSTAANPKRIGKYEILREHGGSNAVIHEAYDPDFDRTVAIKSVIPLIEAYGEGGKSPIVHQFRRELKACGQLHHENILVVHDVVTEEDVPYLVMELLDGQNLQDSVGSQGTFSNSRCKEILEQLLSAVDYLHGKRILHLDIKGANVQLLSSGKVKLIDFGIAKLPRDDSAYMQPGTLGWSPPEQYNEQCVDARSDLFGVAGVAYLLFVGINAFRRGDEKATVSAMLAHQIDFPSGIKPEVVSFLRKGLHPSPDERFQSADEMLGALRALPNDVVAPLPSFSKRPSSFRPVQQINQAAPPALAASQNSPWLSPSPASPINPLIQPAPQAVNRPPVATPVRARYRPPVQIPPGPIAALSVFLGIGCLLFWGYRESLPHEVSRTDQTANRSSAGPDLPSDIIARFWAAEDRGTELLKQRREQDAKRQQESASNKSSIAERHWRATRRRAAEAGQGVSGSGIRTTQYEVKEKITPRLKEPDAAPLHDSGDSIGGDN